MILGAMRATWRQGLAAVVIALLACALYAPTGGYEFVNFDDDVYVYENAQVAGGLTAASARWAFEIHGPSMWIPLTWLSHMAVVDVFGMDAGWHHWANALLHGVNAGLVCLLFFRLVRVFWPSVLAAGLFTFHPLHVESVAWVTERKDVLCLLWILLALHAHLSHRQHGGGWRYLLVIVCHALAVMAKPLAVTLPCVLLLIDAWPQGKMATRRVGWRRAVVEKMPLFAISAVASWMTILCQQSISAISASGTHPLGLRLANAAISYATYLRRLVWPDDLVPYYPYNYDLSVGVVIVSAAVMVAVSGLVVWLWRRGDRRAMIGWLWYLGALVPMIGLIQAGGQAMANRYTYFPFLGIYLCLAVMVARLSRTAGGRRVACVTGVVAIALSVGLSANYVRQWKDSETLFRHVIAVAPDNFLAHNNLGLVLKERGDIAAAQWHYEQALEVNPRYSQANNNLGLLKAEAGDLALARKYFARAVEGGSRPVAALHNLAKVEAALGLHGEALRLFDKALALDETFVDAHYDRGCVLLEMGNVSAAEVSFREVTSRAPERADGWINLGVSLSHAGDLAAAEKVVAQAQAWFPADERLFANLWNLRLRMGDGAGLDALAEGWGGELALRQLKTWADSKRERQMWADAAVLYQRYLQISPNDADVWNNLGVVAGSVGDDEIALGYFERAVALAPENEIYRRNRDAAKARGE